MADYCPNAYLSRLLFGLILIMVCTPICKVGLRGWDGLGRLVKSRSSGQPATICRPDGERGSSYRPTRDIGQAG